MHQLPQSKIQPYNLELWHQTSAKEALGTHFATHVNGTFFCLKPRTVKITVKFMEGPPLNKKRELIRVNDSKQVGRFFIGSINTTYLANNKHIFVSCAPFVFFSKSELASFFKSRQRIFVFALRVFLQTMLGFCHVVVTATLRCQRVVQGTCEC